MQSARFYPAIYPATLSLAVLVAAGCGGSSTPPSPSPTPAACVSSAKPEFSYELTGYAVSMFTVDSCTGQFTASMPATISTGYADPQDNSEQMVADPLGRFVYVANLVSNSSSQSTISMYTINATTGALTPTTPATVPTGWLPQAIAIDPLGRFVYTANTDDSTVSMFTIDPTTGNLTLNASATNPSGTIGALGEPFRIDFDPTGKFVYVTNEGGSVSIYTVNSDGALTNAGTTGVYTGALSTAITQ